MQRTTDASQPAKRVRRGYSLHRGIFASSEMARVMDALSSTSLNRTRAGARHVLRVPAVGQLAGDDRLVALAQEYVGPTAVPFRATLFDKSPDANWLVVWHQDTALPLAERFEDSGWGSWSSKAGVLYARASVGARAGRGPESQSR